MPFVFSQIFAFVALVCIFIAFQCKNKAALLVWNALTNFCLAISYVFLSDWVGVALLSVATVRCVCFFFLRKYEANLHISLSVSCLLLFLIIHCVATTLLWETWFDFVLLGGIMFLTYGLWAKGNNLVRVATVLYATLMIIHNTSVNNWAALSVDIVTIIAIAVYYLHRTILKAKQRKLQ